MADKSMSKSINKVAMKAFRGALSGLQANWETRFPFLNLSDRGSTHSLAKNKKPKHLGLLTFDHMSVSNG
jgi:hypothetical protein